MKIKKFEEFNKKTEKTEKINKVSEARTELFGVDRRPSLVISRQNQDFYDYYTRRKFRGKSKYDLNSDMFKLAQRKDELGTIAQFCLQIERESIAADDYIVKTIDSEIGNLAIDIDQIDGDIHSMDDEINDVEDDMDNLSDEEEI